MLVLALLLAQMLPTPGVGLQGGSSTTIVYNNSTSFFNNGSGPTSFSFTASTVASLSNMVMLCGVSTTISGPTGITVAGSAMTSITSYSGGPTPVSLWWIAAPTSGTPTIVVSGLGGFARTWISCSYYAGVNQTLPSIVNTGNSGSSPFTYGATTTIAGDWLVGTFADAAGGTLVAGTSTAIRVQINGVGIADTNGPIAIPAATNIQVTWAGSDSIGGIVIVLHHA